MFSFGQIAEQSITSHTYSIRVIEQLIIRPGNSIISLNLTTLFCTSNDLASAPSKLEKTLLDRLCMLEHNKSTNTQDRTKKNMERLD